MTTTPILCCPDGNLVGWWVKVPLLGYGRVVSHSPTDISVEFVGRREPVNYPLTNEFEVVPLLEWVRLLADGTIPTSHQHRKLAGRMLKMNPASRRFCEEGHQVKAIAAALRMPLSTARRRVNYLLSWPDVAKENGAKELESPSIEGKEVSSPVEMGV